MVKPYVRRARLPLAVLGILAATIVRAEDGAAVTAPGAPTQAWAPGAAAQSREAPGEQPGAQPAPIAEGTEELIVDLTVNGQALPEPQVLRRAGDGLWLSRETLAAARLHPPGGDADWIELARFPGEHHVLDEERLRLELTVSPEYFAKTQLSLGDGLLQAPDVQRAPMAATVGYDVGLGRDGDGGRWSSLLLDAGVSAGRTSCSTRHLHRSGRHWMRADSSCIVDWPEHSLSLTVGDAVSRPHAMSGSVRYGGIRLGVDRGLQPLLQTQPLLELEGTATLPSLLEVWVDQQLATKNEIPAGDFEVRGIPAVSGRSDLRAVVTDATGRRTVMEVPFYSDASLLRPGLSDWTMEAGRLRTGFLTGDDHYGDAFGSFTWRRGLAPSWTAEVHAELQRDMRMLGMDHHVKLGRFGIAEWGIARSERAGRSGVAHVAGYTYQGRRWNLAARQVRHSGSYSDLAYPAPGSAPLRDAQLGAGVRLGPVLLSATGVLRETVRDGRQRYARAGLSMSLGRGYLTLSGFASLDRHERPLYAATFTLPLSGQRNMSLWADRDDHGMRPGFSVQRNAPADVGYGYHLSHQDNDAGGRDIFDANYRSSRAAMEVSALRTRGATDVRAGVSGSLVATSGGVFLTPGRNQSYALVQLPEPGIRLYRDHQLAAVTNAKGYAIVPGLRPFQRNELAVETDDLSLATRLDDASISVVPGRNQVVRADFNAAGVRPLSLHLLQEDGRPVPAGAVATMKPTGATAAVGHEGLLYVELPDRVDALEIEWAGMGCSVPGKDLPAEPDPAVILDFRCVKFPETRSTHAR